MNPSASSPPPNPSTDGKPLLAIFRQHLPVYLGIRASELCDTDALLLLRIAAEPVTPSELTRVFGFRNGGSISGPAKKLAALGLICRARANQDDAAEDQRFIHYSATEAGRELVARIFPTKAEEPQ